MISNLKYVKYYLGVLYKNWTKLRKSYAQHGEDVLVEQLLPRGINSFIDIGANDGVLFSNTFKFAKSGAAGVCVDPSLSTYRKLCLNHLFHFNVKCIHGAVSSKNGYMFLKEDGYEETLSSVNEVKCEKSLRVKSFTLDTLLNKYPVFKNVDLLSVDVEGHEKEVFEGLKNTHFYSKIIIVESDKSQTHDLLSLNSLYDYEPIFTNGINTVLKNKNERFPSLVKLPKGFVPY